MFDFFFFVALGAGVMSFFSPCILPLIPSYVSFITGTSLTELTERSGTRELRRKIITSSLLFILGFSVIFILLGVSASLVGSILQDYQHWISRIGGIFIVFMGLYLMGIINIPFLDREKRLHLNKNPVNYWVAPLAGVVFAAGWTPCVGPILGSILFYAGSTASVGKGIILLSFYSLGLAIPFFLSSLALEAFMRRYKALRKHMRLVSVISGGILVGMGILLITNVFPFLSFVFSSFTAIS